jgi:hypothetical protein
MFDPFSSHQYLRSGEALKEGPKTVLQILAPIDDLIRIVAELPYSVLEILLHRIVPLGCKLDLRLGGWGGARDP